QLLLLKEALKPAEEAAAAAKDAAKAAVTQADTVRLAERAYVTISHNAPGIDVKGNSGILYFDFTVENFGQTPTNITDILIKPVVVTHGTSLPIVPDYSTKRTVFRKAFLVSKDKFRIFEMLQITQQEITGVDLSYD